MRTTNPARTAELSRIAAFAACFILCSPALQAQQMNEGDATAGLFDEQLPDDQILELETIVVYGGQATPPMWKVSKDGRVLWVVANQRAPAGTTWRMDELEARLGESKLAVFPGTANAQPDVGILKALTLIRSAYKAAKNPDGQTLKDVLPAETYARWLALKTTYVGRDKDIEEWRPSIALAMLEDKIADELRPKKQARSPPTGPALGPALQPLVEKAARKKRVKTRTMPKVVKKVEVKNIRAMIKSTHTLSLVDAQCVAQHLDHIERQVEYWKRQASEVAGVEAPTRPPNCNEADMYIRKVRAGEITDSTGFVKLLDDMGTQGTLAREQLDAEWLAAAEAALAKNSSTFAVIYPMNAQGARSYLEKLRSRGYTVEEPAGAD